MSCSYQLKDSSGHIHEFSSELALDDFLLNQFLYHSSLGDVVFSLTEQQAPIVQELKGLNEQSKELRKVKSRFVHDGESYNTYHDPYIGLSTFLTQYMTTDGKQLTPKFVADNFWNGVPTNGIRVGGRVMDWRQGNFTETEALVLQEQGETVAQDDTNPKIWHGPKITEPEVADKLRKAVELRWEYQCLHSDIIHRVMEVLFSENKKTGNYFKDDVYTNKGAKAWAIKMVLETQIAYKNGDEKIKISEIADYETIEHLFEDAKIFVDQINAKFKNQAIFFPEFLVNGDLARKTESGADKLLGIIDLLVVDKEGKLHIFDYKASLKSYSKYDSAKRRTYMYLIATYSKLLQQNGFDIQSDSTANSLAIVPITIDGFKKTNQNTYVFTGAKFATTKLQDGSEKPVIWYDLTSNIIADSNGGIIRNINEFLAPPKQSVVSIPELLQSVYTSMTQIAPSYNKRLDREKIKKEIEKAGGFTLQTEGLYAGKYVFLPKGSKNRKPPVVDPKALQSGETPEKVMLDKVIAYKASLKEKTISFTLSIREALELGLKTGSVEDAVTKFPKTWALPTTLGASPEWFKLQLENYCNSEWKVMRGTVWSALESLGIIGLYNERSKMYEFIKISNEEIFESHTEQKGSKLLSGFSGKPDSYYKSQGQRINMMESTVGNLELMEAMFAINCILNVFGDKASIGSIKVVNPVHGFSTTAPNHLLLSTFNELDNLVATPLKNNQFKTNKIRFATLYEIAGLKFFQLMALGEHSNWRGKFSRFGTSELSERFTMCQDLFMAALDQNSEVRYAKLLEIKELLEKADYEHRFADLTETSLQEIFSDIHALLYFSVITAMAECKNINFTQQLKDHEQYLEHSLRNGAVFKEGLAGTAYDNPGNFESSTLNKLTELVTQAYQNVRNKFKKPLAESRQLVIALKKRKGYSVLDEWVTGNETKLYQNLYEQEGDRDLRFKFINDPSLCEEEKAFLKYALEKINANRYANKSKEELESMRDANDISYYRVPLCKGSWGAHVARKGVMNGILDYFKSFDPKEAYRRAEEAAAGFLSASEELRRTGSVENFFTMTNTFDAGERPADREYYLGKHDWSYFETNLETLLLKHELAYESKRQIDNIMPLLHAALVHLFQQGVMHNENYVNDLKLAHDYVLNKIKNESIEKENLKEANAISNKIRGVASILALGFSPVQGLYQTLQSLWVDIKLIISKPGAIIRADGTVDSPFTFENFRKAFKTVYKEMFNFKGTNVPTKISRLNELFALNDQDMNNYAELNQQDRHGFTHVKRLAMKFSQRPDYYSRMSIFVAQMMHDGVWDAYELDSKGELQYIWEKDKRFEDFRLNPTGNSPKINLQRALYIAMAKLFLVENAEVEINGKMEKFLLNIDHPMPLPQAYTSKDAESLKSLGDTIYGYYSHEKKSMIQSTFIGGLFMQFKTYWSGKKNQYLGSKGVKLEGKWEQLVTYDKDGKAINWYYPVDEKGVVDWSAAPIPESEATDKRFPVYTWKGDWKEGIMCTLSQLVCEGVQNGDMNMAWLKIWYNPDLGLRSAYRSNLRQLAYDLAIMLIKGGLVSWILADWYKELKDDSDPDDLADAFKLSAAGIAVLSVNNSFMDFNFFDSIGKPMGTWTPFAFEYLVKSVKNVGEVALGDREWYKGLEQSSSVTRQFKPVIDTLFYNPDKE